MRDVFPIETVVDVSLRFPIPDAADASGPFSVPFAARLRIMGSLSRIELRLYFYFDSSRSITINYTDP